VIPVSEQIRKIRDSGSRKLKQALLKDFMSQPDNELFRLVVRHGMEPTIMFNVGKRSIKYEPDKTRYSPESPTAYLRQEDFVALGDLADRKINRTKGAAWANKRVHELIPAEAELLIAILDKDLSWGLGAGSVNEVAPGFLTEFHCMLAAPYDPAAIQYPCRVEPKYDGMRVLTLVDVEKEAVSFYSRTGKSVTSLPESLEAECLALARAMDIASIVLDGEVMGQSFKETMEKARRKDDVFDTARYHIFDWLPRSEFNNISKAASSLPYASRRSRLEKHVAVGSRHLVLPDSYIASSPEEVTHYYNSFRDMSLEGAIVKATHGHYVGKRSPLWIKMKAEETEDLEIVDFEEGEGKCAGTLGALVVNRNGVLIRVGSGLSDDDRSVIWSNPNLYLHKLVEVQYQEVTPDGSLRHPRFVRLRMDKSEW
jgi:DNA ligase-1